MYILITGETMTESGSKVMLKRVGNLSDLMFNIRTLEKLKYAFLTTFEKFV